MNRHDQDARAHIHRALKWGLIDVGYMTDSRYSGGDGGDDGGCVGCELSLVYLLLSQFRGSQEGRT